MPTAVGLATAALATRRVELIAADKPDAFQDDTPTATLIRQVLGAVSQFEKAMIVSKLKDARDRKRRDTGMKVEGRKSYAEARPEVVTLAKKLHRYPVNGHRRSLREVSLCPEQGGWHGGLSWNAAYRNRGPGW